MAKDEDGAHEATAEPSFNDPNDPRWSRNPHPAPPRNPYLDMPLDAPPVAGGPSGRGEGFSGQGGEPGPNAGQQGGGQSGYPQQYPPQQYPPQQYPQPGHPVQVQQPAGTLAIVSLVTGIIAVLTGGMLVIPQIAAVICGHMALKREPHMRGIAIAGLVTGYLMLGFIVLAALFIIIATFVAIGGW